MKRYIAFLRGINISGKNKVPMADLKNGLETLGFSDVKTYLNSGNAAFSSEKESREELTKQVEAMLKTRFGFDIPVFVIHSGELAEILRSAPEWWGSENKEIYDNLIFIMPPATFAEVINGLGAPREEFEKIQGCKEAIFWSFIRKDYQKTNWWAKTAREDIGGCLTIRTANTVRKAAEM